MCTHICVSCACPHAPHSPHLPSVTHTTQVCPSGSTKMGHCRPRLNISKGRGGVCTPPVALTLTYPHYPYTLTSHRYIWAYRNALARTVHDMSKQAFDNKKWCTAAWKPLSDYLFSGDDQRLSLVTSFNKKDTEFHQVVAECLWNLTRSAGLPWGRGATQPLLYSQLPPYDKVLPQTTITVVFFFFFLTLTCITHMCDRVGLSRLEPVVSWGNVHP